MGRPISSARVRLGQRGQKWRPNAPTQMDARPLFLCGRPIPDSFFSRIYVGTDTRRTRARLLLSPGPPVGGSKHHFPLFFPNPLARARSRPTPAMDDDLDLDAAAGLASLASCPAQDRRRAQAKEGADARTTGKGVGQEEGPEARRGREG